MLRARTLPLALAALCLAGCGPPKAATPGHFTLDATSHCLKKLGLPVAVDPADLDFISATAPAGALRSRLKHKPFVIAFGDTRDDSDLLVSGYRRSAPNALARKRLGSLLDLEGNAVVYWQTEPRPREVEQVRACLQ